MKLSFVLTPLIFSSLALNAQNLINTQVQVVNYTNLANTQQSVNINQQSFNVNVNDNNNNVQLQTNRGGGSSAMLSFGNNNSNTNKSNKVQQKTTAANNKSVIKKNADNLTNNDVALVNRGNNFTVNDNVLENNVGNQGMVQYRGGNVINDVNINSNPVVNDTKKTITSKPVVEYQGLDFKPSGLSGRDYSNGGKMKKGQKNFYAAHATKTKTVHRKKPSFKKAKVHTSKCAKW
jgi:hypothetical protein